MITQDSIQAALKAQYPGIRFSWTQDIQTGEVKIDRWDSANPKPTKAEIAAVVSGVPPVSSDKQKLSNYPANDIVEAVVKALNKKGVDVSVKDVADELPEKAKKG